MSKLGAAARAYAGNGWAVFPCRPRSKAPITTDGFHAATADPDQVAAWWHENPNANIGFVPGRAGLLVLDSDSPEGEALAERLGLLALPTLAARTPRGWHRYFLHPGGVIGNRKLVGLLDVRGDRGYVLLPPSIHPTGHVYSWRGNVQDVAPLPSAALDALQEPERPAAPATYSPPPIDAGTARRRAYVAAAIEAECLALARTAEHDRNNTLNRAAFALARFIATGEADPAKLAEALEIAARAAGLKRHEIKRTIESAFDARGVSV